MTDFNNILKQKIEQFKVPYNKAHWVEMEAKLNAISHQKIIKRNFFIAASIIAVLSISSYLYLQQTNNKSIIALHNNLNITTQKHTKTANNQTIKIKHNNLKQQKIPHTTITKNKKTIANNTSATPIKNTKPTNNTNGVIDSVATTQLPVKSKIITNTTPTTEFIIYNGNVCLGNAVSFEAIEHTLPVTYLWNFGDGTSSSKAKPNHTYVASGVYNISLTLTNKKTGKKFSNIMKNAVNIYPKPVANFSWEETALKHDDNKLKYPYINFKVKTNKQNNYNWSFSNGTISKEKNPEILFNTKGEYTVTLNVKNTFGCTNTTSKTINVKQSFLLNDYTPTGFAPNSNYRENSTFIPKALLVMDVQFKMTITNNVGDIVYQTTDKNSPWNGKLNNTGAILDAGVYFWKVITIDVENIAHQHAGTITLIK